MRVRATGVYNVALNPLAAGMLHTVSWVPDVIRNLHPAIAAGAMAFSSVTEIMKSLRLPRKKLWTEFGRGVAITPSALSKH